MQTAYAIIADRLSTDSLCILQQSSAKAMRRKRQSGTILAPSDVFHHRPQRPQQQQQQSTSAGVLTVTYDCDNRHRAASTTPRHCPSPHTTFIHIRLMYKLT